MLFDTSVSEVSILTNNINYHINESLVQNNRNSSEFYLDTDVAKIKFNELLGKINKKITSCTLYLQSYDFADYYYLVKDNKVTAYKIYDDDLVYGFYYEIPSSDLTVSDTIQAIDFAFFHYQLNF